MDVECACLDGSRLWLLLLGPGVADRRRGECGLSCASPEVGVRLEVELAADARLDTLEKLALLLIAFECPAPAAS